MCQRAGLVDEKHRARELAQKGIGDAQFRLSERHLFRMQRLAAVALHDREQELGVVRGEKVGADHVPAAIGNQEVAIEGMSGDERVVVAIAADDPPVAGRIKR